MSEIKNDSETRIMTISQIKFPRRTVPYVRIANNYLWACGFKVGDKISVTYQQDKLIITKI